MITPLKIAKRRAANTVVLMSLAFALAALASTAWAQVAQKELPKIAQGIGVTEQLGQDLPLHLDFEDDKNRAVQFGELFKDNKPVLLSFNYSDCPKLCVVQLNNLAGELQHIDLVPGEDFHIVSVSLDPNEQATQLAATKLKYVTAYGDMDTLDGWHFLRGTKTNIGDLAEACGFQYKYDVKTRIYSHPAAFIFCTADGRISRYLNGLDGQLGKSLKPALVEAGKGRIGSLSDRVKYFAGCYIFDPTTGKYSLSAIKAMRLAGFFTILCLVVGITPYFLRQSHNKTAATSADEKLAAEQRAGSVQTTPDESALPKGNAASLSNIKPGEV